MRNSSCIRSFSDLRQKVSYFKTPFVIPKTLFSHPIVLFLTSSRHYQTGLHHTSLFILFHRCPLLSCLITSSSCCFFYQLFLFFVLLATLFNLFFFHVFEKKFINVYENHFFNILFICYFFYSFVVYCVVN